MTTTSSPTTYRTQIARLRRAIVISWMVNILVLSLTIEAVIIFAFLSTRATNGEIMAMLRHTIPVSVIIGIAVTWIVSLSSSHILMSGVTGDMIEQHDGVVYNVVEEMSIAANIPTPRVYVLAHSGIANAYAVSDRTGSRVVITDGLLALVNRQELQGVVAHEIGHIVSGDSRSMTTVTAMTAFTGIVAGSAWRMFGGNDKNRGNSINPVAIVLIVLSFLFLLAAPFLAKLSESCMSRERESNADMLSVKFTNNPSELAGALYRLEAGEQRNNAHAAKKFDKRAGYLAFYAPEHLKGINLDTHPPIEDRINKLVSMGATLDPSRHHTPLLQ